MNNFWYHPYNNLPPWFWTQLKGGGWDSFVGQDVACILVYQPQLHPFLDLSTLDEEDITWILKYRPQLQNLF